MLKYNSETHEYREDYEEPEELIEIERSYRISKLPALEKQFSTTSSTYSETTSIYGPYDLARIIKKFGRRNITLKNFPGKHLSYVKDLGNTLVSIKWRWIIATLLLTNFVFSIVSAALWMMLAHTSGDLETNDPLDVCIVNTKSFTGYFILSVETFTSIGSGYYYPTEKCGYAWAIISFQAVIDIVLKGAFITAIYVKTSKPKPRTFNSLFSNKAVINLRDGKLHFIFRINDVAGKILCGTKISLYFINKEDLEDPFKLVEMKVEQHGALIFPIDFEHVIDAKSPLWNFSPDDLMNVRFEIIAVAEGTSVITGQMSQNKTSYTNKDTLWGHRFCECITFDDKRGKYIINYRKFKQTVPHDTPVCSASKLADIEKY